MRQQLEESDGIIYYNKPHTTHVSLLQSGLVGSIQLVNLFAGCTATTL